ncbi:MAG: hypothetical protein M3Y72_14230 [Acidobacteriota bacterium]|nr:hypothetical protein [Acidobacteriota bacterium]
MKDELGPREIDLMLSAWTEKYAPVSVRGERQTAKAADMGLAMTKKSVKAAKVEAPLTRAGQLFQGQNHPKKRKKIVRMEQWIEVRIRDGKTVTRLYPPNEKLIKDGQKMLPPPEFVYRRLNFPDGVPHEYDWTGIPEEQRALGGCGLQRMTVETWLDVIDREKLLEDGHVGPTGVGNLPRPQEHGECSCRMCVWNQGILDGRAAG